MSASDVLQDIIDRIVDEGDRAYLGSTNDVERLKRAVAEVEKIRADLAVEARDLIKDIRAKRDLVSPDEDEIGAVVWHSSDEDSGPDVGISLGLGNSRSLWLGELAKATLEDAGVAVDDGGMGWWLAMAGPNEMQVIAPVTDPEAGRALFDMLARLLARA